MEILDIQFSRDIEIIPVYDRWYRIPFDFYIDIYLRDEGVVRIIVKKDFEFDGRSGGIFADLVAPNLGSQNEVKAWLLHDLCGYDIYFSFNQTNRMLYNNLRKNCKYGYWRAHAIWFAVSATSSWFGKPKPSDREYVNSDKILVRHNDI